MRKGRNLRPIADAFAQVLLNHHKQICRNERDLQKCLITYGELCGKARPSIAPIGAGLFLGEIATRCKELQMPPLNALVVNKRTGEPGPNYPGGVTAWQKDVKDCIAFKKYRRGIG